METTKIHPIDLYENGNNYASFSGYIVSNQSLNNQQLETITNYISNEHQNLSIRNFDNEGEFLEDYCAEFNFFSLSCLEKGCFIILDINIVEEGNTDADLTEVFLSNNDGYLLIFELDGNISTKII